MTPGRATLPHRRSPLRGPWLTAALGLVLLLGVTVLVVTGLLSCAAYEPDLPGDDATPGHALLGASLFDRPTDPPWLYRLTQGAHVALVPVVLATLWSVVPRLFELPTGPTTGVCAGRRLGVTGVLVAGSALVHAVRVRRARRPVSAG